MKARVVVLISGGGSNLQALVNATKQPDCPYIIVSVISNRPGAGGLKRAREAGISQHAIDHKGYSDRPSFEADLVRCIDSAAPDFIVCAGFMRILTETCVARYEGRMINIHPSLLPNFRGLNTHARAIASGVGFAGCTVHWVSAGVDEGAIIGQAIVPTKCGETSEGLAARVVVQEHRLYPACLDIVASGRAVLLDGANFIDGQRGTLAMLPDGTLA